MKNLKFIFISTIIIFIINFPVHFLFNFIQNDIISVFFPTNESIFQHMKMIFTSFFIFYFIIFIIRKRLKFENIFITNLISSIGTISFFLVIYIPIYLYYKDNMIFTLILLFISIMFGQILGSIIIIKRDYKIVDIFSFILISIIFVICGYLTFYPLHNFLFWDSKHETYERVLK